MTMFQKKAAETAAQRRARMKDAVEKKHAELDAQADGLLDKLRASKWTAAILIGGAVAVAVWALA